MPIGDSRIFEHKGDQYAVRVVQWPGVPADKVMKGPWERVAIRSLIITAPELMGVIPTGTLKKMSAEQFADLLAMAKESEKIPSGNKAIVLQREGEQIVKTLVDWRIAAAVSHLWEFSSTNTGEPHCDLSDSEAKEFARRLQEVRDVFISGGKGDLPLTPPADLIDFVRRGAFRMSIID